LPAAAVIGGLVALTIPFWRFGDAWWIVFLTVPAGVFTIAIGILGVRWVARASIPDNGEGGLSSSVHDS
jgi:hypothetical protein